MSFVYTGYNKGGEPVKGVVKVSSADEAVEKLRRQGVFVTELKPADDAKAERAAAAAKRRPPRGASRKQVALFARELSVLISTGTPIADAIFALEKQAANDGWRSVVGAVRRGLEEGDSFAEALGRRSEVFDSVFVSLVAAGESSGQLDTMLHRLALLTRRQAQVRSSIIGAMAYPVLLTTICLIVLGLMLGVVLPRFSGLFETLDTPLPATTKMLVAISDGIMSSWMVVVPCVAGGIAAGVWYLKTPAGRRLVDDLLLALPKVGDVVRSFGTARVARLMGTLLAAKVPMLEAIELTRRSTSNHRFVQMLDRAEKLVTKGEPVSMALIETKVFIPSAAQAVRNGEQSGRLSEVFVHIADYLDEENQSTVKSLSSLLEPLIMIVLGGLVAFVAVSMFLPLFDLTASAGGGA